MTANNKVLALRILLMLACAWLPGANAAQPSQAEPRVIILVYHRFAVKAEDSMTVRIETFEAQLGLLRAHGYRIVPLRDVLKWRQDPAATLPPKTAVLTADDGHRSVFDVLLPIAMRDRLPVTLFVYPSAISNASYALTWGQLRTLKQSGLFDIQSHTYWHPNFNHERQRLAPTDYRQFVHRQLEQSRARIEAEVGGHVDMLAWPFGIYDDQLLALAAGDGYVAGFTLDARPVERDSPLLAMPRFLIVEGHGTSAFARLLGESEQQTVPASGGRP
ncbi:polysaccharide deacetylase family protein [Caballeronia humi]|uniref:Polysaccharide deacetylase family protein n=1 Tax=Caballeronia humi TaxID=326474 RepID=A0A158IZT7_9BURK|nr:polysaccharide deacetylase family protein [Caballeronia humi]SAL61629.1 polysaccharide deacetylase family protein [Caballeronia humi]